MPFLRRHSPGAGRAGITNCVDHVSDGDTPGSAVLCELTRHFHPVLSPSCVAEDWRLEKRSQVGLDRGCPCLQLASSPSAPRARWCGKEKVLDQLTFGTFCSMAKPAEPSLHEQCRYTCKAEAAIQFHRWHTVRPYSYIHVLAQAMSRNRRAKLSALLPGRPCSLYATIFHAATKDRIVG